MDIQVIPISKHKARQFLGLSDYTFKRMEKDGRLKPDCEFAENKYTLEYLRAWKERYNDAKHEVEAIIKQEKEKNKAKGKEVKD